MRKAKPAATLTLESYVELFRDPSHHQRLLANLQQVLHMHGFLRMHGRLKRDIIEALEAVELMPPTRSTLAGGAQAAELTAEEARRDFEAIDWLTAEGRVLPGFAGRRPRSRRKHMSINAIVSAGGAGSPPATADA